MRVAHRAGVGVGVVLLLALVGGALFVGHRFYAHTSKPFRFHYFKVGFLFSALQAFVSSLTTFPWTGGGRGGGGGASGAGGSLRLQPRLRIGPRTCRVQQGGGSGRSTGEPAGRAVLLPGQPLTSCLSSGGQTGSGGRRFV